MFLYIFDSTIIFYLFLKNLWADLRYLFIDHVTYSIKTKIKPQHLVYKIVVIDEQVVIPVDQFDNRWRLFTDRRHADRSIIMWTKFFYYTLKHDLQHASF